MFFPNVVLFNSRYYISLIKRINIHLKNSKNQLKSMILFYLKLVYISRIIFCLYDVQILVFFFSFI